MNFCPYCQLPLEVAVAQCPSCYADLSSVANVPRPAAAPRAGGTVVESIQTVREAVIAKKTGTVREAMTPPPSAIPKVPKPEQANDDTLPFQPLTRPPTPKLCVLDDGSATEGEWHRIREDQFIIGRNNGNLIIPHDENISGRHAAILRRVEEGRYRYYLRDLNSRNGTFIRVARVVLRTEQELLIGARRFTFYPGSTVTPEEAPSSGAAASTRGWQVVKPPTLNTLLPALVELTPEGEGLRLQLRDADLLLGRDRSQCQLLIEDDLYVSPVHLRVTKDKRGRWQLENVKSKNGLWLRIEEAPFESDGEFQLGEQRFLLKFPASNEG